MIQLMLVLAASIAVFAIAPSGAGAVAINSSSIGVSNTQAGSHPDVSISFTRNGTQSEDIQTANVELPPGMFANPEAVPNKCSVATFNSDGCADSALVGSLSVDITAASLLPLNIPGAVYVLQPNANDTATLGLVLRPNKICILFVFCAVPQKVFLQTNVKLETFDTETGLKTFTTGAPKTTTVAIPPIVSASNGLKLDITIEKMTLNFQGKAGVAPQPVRYWWGGYGPTPPDTRQNFMVASTSCRPSVAKIDITTYNGGSASKQASYTPTGCQNVPFNPSITFAPSNTSAGISSPATFTMDVPQAEASIQNAHPQIVDVDFPTDSSVDLGQLAGVQGCTETLLRADNCPTSSVIGNAAAIAPYLPPALSGTVYAMDPIGASVPMAVVLRGARGSRIIFRGTLGVRTPAGGPNRAYARFDKVPQLPYAQVTVNLTTPVYKNPDLSTCGPQTSTAHILGYNGSTGPDYTNGTSVDRTATYTLTNCNQAPETTITTPPLSPSSDVTPTWAFQSSLPNSSFVCSVDGGATFACNDDNVTASGKTNGSYTSPALTAGNHTFSVYAVNGVTQDATPATSSIVIQTTGTITPTIVSSTTAPAAHPNIDFTADVSGGQPASLLVQFPSGFVGSLKARPLCSGTDAAAGNCAAASSIGTVNLTLNTPSGPQTGVGTAYLTGAQNALTDAGGVSIKATFSFGTFIAQAGAYLTRTGNSYYETLDIRSIPDMVGTTPVGLKQLKISFDGVTNKFLTNATSCAAGAFVATGTATDGTGYPSSSAPYSSTGCSNTVPPFAPTLTQVLSNPVASTTTTPQETGVVADVTVGSDNGSIKTFAVKEPASLVPNYPAFGTAATDQCTAGSIVNLGTGQNPNYTFNYSAANCPTQAKVGSMTINTPLLPTPLVGDVYLVNRGSLPSFGVKFDQPGISVRLVGITRIDSSTCDETVYDLGCPDQILVTFDNVPDTPITSVNFALNGGPRAGATQTLSGNLLKTAVASDTYACRAHSPAASTVTSWAGQVRTLSQDIAITGCENP